MRDIGNSRSQRRRRKKVNKVSNKQKFRIAPTGQPAQPANVSVIVCVARVSVCVCAVTVSATVQLYLYLIFSISGERDTHALGQRFKPFSNQVGLITSL